jgi:DNA-binding ferritin-like protein
MNLVALQLLTLRLFAQRAHHDTQGPTFFEDHKMFGKLYEAYGEAYDSAVERTLGLGIKLDLAKLAQDAAKNAAFHPNEHSPEKLFSDVMSGEKNLCSVCVAAMAKASEGTKNLLAQFCDDSEKRQFLIQKRIMPASNS